ncbi:MAG: replication-associated recombination protein A [Patescibacteria group bacterium]
MPDTLFTSKVYVPLADRMRAKELDEVFGQEELTDKNSQLSKMIETRQFKSCVLWGPPGSGKTTIARIIAKHTDCDFVELSAVFSGVAELREVFKKAKESRKFGKGTILFVDEIHRFNKSQQDSFLPYVENGTIILVGATTENPSFELNSALLSRCQVFVLKRLDEDALKKLFKKAEDFLNKKIKITKEIKDIVIKMADGDGRFLLNIIEIIADEENLTEEKLKKLLNRRLPLYDKAGEGHYNLISALHKSLRGSDTNASLYWLARMLSAGQDPKYILRRLTRFAYEDVGLADPNAIVEALSSWEIYERMGSPEGELVIAQLVIYLATSPKSNSVYKAFGKAMDVAKETGSLMPPKHILNAPTKLMKDIGYGEGYLYDHDTEDCFSGQNYFPEEMKRENFYEPNERGFEREIKKRLDYWDLLRKKKNNKK